MPTEASTEANRMAISRRNFLGKIGAAAVAGAAMNPLISSAQAGQLVSMSPSPTKDLILLNRNENPYGPSERVLLAIQRSLASANRFPDLACDALISQISALHKVKRDQVILGCGSTEILRSAANAFLGPGKSLILSSPTFDAIGTYAAATGAAVVTVPLNRFFANDLDGILSRIDASTELIYICTPNNPTAILNPRSDLEDFIGKLPGNTRVIIDEAYHHYAGNSSSYASFIDRPVDSDRVIVVRTFSKIHGLAGLRVGYGIAASKTARQIASFSVNNNVSVVAAEAAAAALEDTHNVEMNIKRNSDGRQEFFNQAYARMMRPVDSHGNFVFFKTTHPTEYLIEHFKAHNILIGPPYPSLENYIRVSIGLPEEMTELWRVWNLMPFVNQMAM